MAETDNLRLPYLIAAQAQKHVTHNEALRSLDAVVHLALEDRDLSDPPPAPTDGARYLVAAAATGAWSGHDGDIAAYQDGAWMFHTAREGWIAWVSDEDAALVYDGTSWVTLTGGGGGSGGSVNPTPLVGINATADTTNRLSVSSPASLLNHEGAGHQLKINKATAADTAALLYQTAFSGRAEMGLTGDDDFHVKVSADGAAWNDAIVIDKATGSVSFPNTALGGGGFTPFASRASLRQTSADTVPTGVFTVLSWQTEVEDIGGWFTSGSPTRLTVPSGIALVEIRALLKLSGAAGTNGVIQVNHYNSSSVLQASYIDGFNFNLQWAGSIVTPAIAVSAGDYFTMTLFQNSGASRTTDTTFCNFTIAGIA